MTLAEIEEAINHKEDELRALYAKLDAASRQRNAEILRMFDGGTTYSAIAKHFGMPPTKVKAYLFRNGRTNLGRDALRAAHASLRLRGHPHAE